MSEYEEQEPYFRGHGRPPATAQRWVDDGEEEGPCYQYSQCTGQHKALLIGINYIGQDGELGGCINDAEHMSEFLVSHYGYDPENIHILRDDSDDEVRPTRENMLNHMEWLVTDAQPDDSLFFYYSGHGTHEVDMDGDEHDGRDECIRPVDYAEAGNIRDDQLHSILVSTLPQGCRLTAIFDSCHSGSILDLPFSYNTEGVLEEPNLAQEAADGTLGQITEENIHDIVQQIALEQQVRHRIYATKTSSADVITFTGCRDDQLSYENPDVGMGAMSHAFVRALTAEPTLTYNELLNRVHEILENEYEQKPVLSSSHPLDVDLEWIM